MRIQKYTVVIDNAGRTSTHHVSAKISGGAIADAMDEAGIPSGRPRFDVRVVAVFRGHKINLVEVSSSERARQ